MEWTEILKSFAIPVFITAFTAWMQVDRMSIKRSIKDLREEVNEWFVKLEKYHVADDFLTKLNEAEIDWYEIDRVLIHEKTIEISAQIQKRTKDIVASFFKDIANTNYTLQDFEITERKVKSLLQIERERGRIDFPCFTEQQHITIDNLLRFRAEQMMVKLEDLAKDNIFNEKIQRMQYIVLQFYKDYRADIIRFLLSWEIMR
jgi:hypothetical protein